MEKNKLIFKPFDLKKAKEGKPVCTRDGRKVRIICFDRNNRKNPIIALVEDESVERVYSYSNNGRYCSTKKSQHDLVMLSKKYVGYINIYKSTENSRVICNLYSTKEEAMINYNESYIKTIKIEWEE